LAPLGATAKDATKALNRDGTTDTTKKTSNSYCLAHIYYVVFVVSSWLVFISLALLASLAVEFICR